jgi:hypothetical protein
MNKTTVQPAPSGSSQSTCYRLLDCNDEIRSDDEFLEDDETTWTRIDIHHEWNVGSYWNTALKPMRRILGDNVKVSHPDSKPVVEVKENNL